MFCPRINHFARLNQNGTIGKCGHMNTTAGFKTFYELEKSDWLRNIQNTMDKDKWPEECVRCQRTEEVTGESIRTKSIARHKMLHPVKEDYLVIGGVLDNVCNSACQTCYDGLSTKIGSLKSKNYIRVNNYKQFWKFPQDRILEVDVNGGEPTASKNYKRILNNLPRNTKIVRMNTNGSRMINEIITLLKKKIMVIVTISFDGTEDVHDYVRWPIKWEKFTKTVQEYKKLQKQYKLLKLNFWTTVSCLNIEDFPNIIKYASDNNIDHDWAFLNNPDVLNVKYKNPFTVNAKIEFLSSNNKILHAMASQIATDSDNTDGGTIANNPNLSLFIKKQDYLRKININDYFSFDENLFSTSSAKAK